MDTAEDDDDLKLVKASAGLLSDLELALPKLLWRPSQTASSLDPESSRKHIHFAGYLVCSAAAPSISLL